ncbi:MAG: YIP1 family protein, partial [Calditrichia bacterium]|nr:YIP1 family protein [Calditrichia bacterium]
MTENLETVETPDVQEKELTLMNKILGILIEPIKTFEKIAMFPAKAADWLIPIILFLFIASISQIIYSNTPAIKEQMMQMEVSISEDIFSSMVANGHMTQEKADEQLEEAYRKAEESSIIGKIIVIIIMTFLGFFIVSTVFFVLAKFIFGDNGTYSSSLAAFGIPYYIAAIQILILLVVSLVTNRAIIGTSLAALLDYDVFAWNGFLLGRINVFTI